MPLLWLMSRLPLSVIRGIGGYLGVVITKRSKRSWERLKNNLLLTKLANPDNVTQVATKAASEMGKTFLEAACIAWVRCKKYNNSLVLKKINLDKVKEAVARGGPIVFLTPHIGNFEVALKATAYELPQQFTILYKPTKVKWVHDLMYNGRAEDNIKPVPTNRHGVVALFKALRNNEFLGLLPDSVASQGNGVWTNFLGQKVFATTLATKFMLSENVTTFIVASTRVEGGFIVEYIPFIPSDNNIANIVQGVYNVLEKIVLRAPTQYFWSYDRFRIPRSNPRSCNGIPGK